MVFALLLALLLACHGPPDLLDEIRAAPSDDPRLVQCLEPRLQDDLAEAALQAARARGHRFDDTRAFAKAIQLADAVDIMALPDQVLDPVRSRR